MGKAVGIEQGREERQGLLSVCFLTFTNYKQTVYLGTDDWGEAEFSSVLLGEQSNCPPFTVTTAALQKTILDICHKEAQKISFPAYCYNG